MSDRDERVGSGGSLSTCLLATALLVALAGCGGGGGGGSSAAPAEDGTSPVSVRDSCVVRLRLADAVPDMRLRNFDSPCDYYLDSSVIFTGDVVIEAGTVVISEAGHFAAFEDGSLTALGTEANPIIFRSEEALPGNWFGVRAMDLSRLSMAHVEVRDGGAAAGVTSIVDIAALRIGTRADAPTTDVSLVDVVVSGSAADGLDLGERLNVTAFARNTFSGNAGAGVSLDTEVLAALDAESDYLGQSAANGDPVIKVARLSLSGEETYTVPNLGAPIRFGSAELGAITAQGSSVLRISPGAELSFDAGTGLRIGNQAQFYSQGTVDDPVTLSALSGETWLGIRLVSTREVVIENTVLGRTGSVGDTFPGAIAVNAFPNVTLRDLTIDTTADWGVYCTRPYPTLSVSEISVFNAAVGAVHPDCGAVN